MNKSVWIGLGVVVLLVGGYFFLRSSYAGPTSQTDLVPTKNETTVDSTNIVVTSRNFTFVSSELTVEQGKEVNITFQNSGTHTFTIAELGINQRLSGSSPGVQFTPTRPGIYEFYCAIPGHRERGMVGTLTVK